MGKGCPTGRGLVGESSILDGHGSCRQGTAQTHIRHTRCLRVVWWGQGRVPTPVYFPYMGNMLCPCYLRAPISSFPIGLQGPDKRLRIPLPHSCSTSCRPPRLFPSAVSAFGSASLSFLPSTLTTLRAYRDRHVPPLHMGCRACCASNCS